MDPILKRIGDVTIERLTTRESPGSSTAKNVTMDTDSGSESPGSSDDELNADADFNEKLLALAQSQKRKTLSDTDDDDVKIKKSKSDEVEIGDKVAKGDKLLRTIVTDDEDSEYDSEEDSDMEAGIADGKLLDSDKSDGFIEKFAEIGESSQKSGDEKIDASDYDYDITEKLKEMGEISVETVKKGDKPRKVESESVAEEISVTPAKKDSESNDESSETNLERKTGNLRRNIREVMDENQLDEATLAAQRQEMERLRRVQEQQRIIREVQRQIALNRQNNKTQHRVISLLQGGNSSIMKQLPGTSGASTPGRLGGTVLVKLPNGETKPMTRISKGQAPFEVVRMQKSALQVRNYNYNFLNYFFLMQHLIYYF